MTILEVRKVVSALNNFSTLSGEFIVHPQHGSVITNPEMPESDPDSDFVIAFKIRPDTIPAVVGPKDAWMLLSCFQEAYNARTRINMWLRECLNPVLVAEAGKCIEMLNGVIDEPRG